MTDPNSSDPGMEGEDRTPNPDGTAPDTDGPEIAPKASLNIDCLLKLVRIGDEASSTALHSTSPKLPGAVETLRAMKLSEIRTLIRNICVLFPQIPPSL